MCIWKTDISMGLNPVTGKLIVSWSNSFRNPYKNLNCCTNCYFKLAAEVLDFYCLLVIYDSLSRLSDLQLSTNPH